MRQNGVDQGPRVANTFDRHPRHPEAPDCGPVRILRKSPFREVLWPPYTEEERAEIVRRGKEEPRRLTLAEERLVRKNRASYQDDIMAMEHWYQDLTEVEADEDVDEDDDPEDLVSGVTLARPVRCQTDPTRIL